VSVHTKAIVVARQTDRKIVGWASRFPFNKKVGQLVLEYGVLCKCVYSPTIQSTHIMRAVALRTVQKFRFLIYDYESYNYKIY
jgi:hypothetical protein